MTRFYKYIGLFAVLFAVHVTGIDFTFSRDRVVIGSTGTLTMTCDVTENDVENIYLIQILRETMSGSGNFESVVEMENADGPVLKVTNNKDFVAGGTYDLGNTDLSVSMNISKLQCNDAKTYKCALTYKSTTVSTPLTLEKNGTLSAYVYPNVKELEAERNGKEEYKGSLPTDKATFAIGDELELTCTATIGSLPATTISWRKTSEIGQTNNFIGYQPQAGTFDEGTAISDSECGYTRVATITYNTTVNDASRAEDNPLAFECYVSVSGNPYGTTYTTQNNPRFYADVSGGDETPSSDTATAGMGSNIGAIIGGVVGGLLAIIIIVVVVWFLWFRRQRDGADYTTKEEYGSENPNMAPPVDTYASVDKHRNRGVENRGLDEPHETRRHHYENGPGKSNYAMDRDADDYDYDSRDGSPTRSNQGINHMGMDPQGGIGTGV